MCRNQLNGGRRCQVPHTYQAVSNAHRRAQRAESALASFDAEHGEELADWRARESREKLVDRLNKAKKDHQEAEAHHREVLEERAEEREKAKAAATSDNTAAVESEVVEKKTESAVGSNPDLQDDDSVTHEAEDETSRDERQVDQEDLDPEAKKIYDEFSTILSDYDAEEKGSAALGSNPLFDDDEDDDYDEDDPRWSEGWGH